MTTLYFDYAASTPIDASVSDAMVSALQSPYLQANPASNHRLGQMAKAAIADARKQVAELINASPEEILWTSGATESDNLAIKGIAKLYAQRGRHIVTMATEHKAVLEACQSLEKEGFKVSYLQPQPNGVLDLREFEAALTPETILVSIMHVNNETGIMQPIEAIAEITAAKNILLHVDAAQSAGKIALDVSCTPINLLSLSAHKLYGPKGMGALYIRHKPRIRLHPLFHGGGHERGMRPGTLATHQIIGMGKAFSLAKARMSEEQARMIVLRERFLSRLKHKVIVNGDVDAALANIFNLRFPHNLANEILSRLPQLAASTASACQGQSGVEGSYVLRAMQMSSAEIEQSIRFSIGRFTTEQCIDNATNALLDVI